MYREVEDPWAYLAGFIEGDGSLVLSKYRRWVFTTLSIGQKERAILDYFQKMTGVGRVHKKQAQRPTHGTGTMYCWTVASRTDLERVLPKLVPHLFSSKKRKARLMLLFCRLRSVEIVGRRGLSPEIRKRRRLVMRKWEKTYSNEIKRVTNPSYSLLAGFVDADGSVGTSSKHRYWRIRAAQKERPLLDYLREEAGGLGNICMKKTQGNIYVWTITNPKFIRTLNQYLKIKRKNMN